MKRNFSFIYPVIYIFWNVHYNIKYDEYSRWHLLRFVTGIPKFSKELYPSSSKTLHTLIMRGSGASSHLKLWRFWYSLLLMHTYLLSMHRMMPRSEHLHSKTEASVELITTVLPAAVSGQVMDSTTIQALLETPTVAIHVLLRSEQMTQSIHHWFLVIYRKKTFWN